MLRVLAAATLVLIPAAAAGTTVCRPTFNDMFEFECREKEGVKNSASFCEVMNRQGGPIMWSRNDTSETKNRADLVNAVGKRLCGWGKK
ncbi:hypothetical protein [Bradyrhizobium sp. CCH5-F6]|uniref:hypothetical protein n=1 Tax=Bradyrhizobium sp. CCH5-F6 TaxID=1768753 RepID=UPI000769F38B|nr:hypothetical protein [Bradyrhizobium sp. CCH5-F6]